MKLLKKFMSAEIDDVLRIQTVTLKAIHDLMYSKGVTQLMPVILSTVTDPLCHSVFDAKIEYYGQKLTLTKSMILHKQLALFSPKRKAIYIVSPNVRLEKKECQKTGRHLVDFSQVDFEFKHATKEEIIRFMEELVPYVFTAVKKECHAELKRLGRKLTIPQPPFKQFYTFDAEKRFGKDYEATLSKKEKKPFWLLSHEREFYDKEDTQKPGTYLNYDLIYPEGYGEALSGGEREYEYKRIVARMKRQKVSLTPYKRYLYFARKGLLHKSAGAGFGVERMVRFISGRKHIEEVSLFAKVPGKKIVF